MALRSPSALAETGLPMCLAEKCQTVTVFDAEQSVLCSPVCLGIIAKYGLYSGILVESKRDFSAVKTEWRSGKDSNPRYRSETCKSRRLRKLRGINRSQILRGLHAPHSKRQTVQFREAKRWRWCG